MPLASSRPAEDSITYRKRYCQSFTSTTLSTAALASNVWSLLLLPASAQTNDLRMHASLMNALSLPDVSTPLSAGNVLDRGRQTDCAPAAAWPSHDGGVFIPRLSSATMCWMQGTTLSVAWITSIHTRSHVRCHEAVTERQCSRIVDALASSGPASRQFRVHRLATHS